MSDRQTYEQLADQRDDLASRLREVTNELETERMRLAACSTAAIGYFNGCIDEYKSAALNDVLALQERTIELQRQLDEAAGQEPVGYIGGTFFGGDVKWTAQGASLRTGDKLYAHPINLSALIEQAKAEEREECAARVQALSGSKWVSPEAAGECEDAIRARKP